MSIGNLCSTGKKENSSGSELYINIINIPSGVSNLPTNFAFLSNIKIENFNDLLDACQFYEDYSQSVILIGGEYIQDFSNRYMVHSLWVNYIELQPQDNSLMLTYRDSINGYNSVLITYINTPPQNWTYINIKL